MAILGYDKFNLVKLLETRGLPGWLEIASDDLEASAKQRIANEIGVHYAEAVSAHLVTGEPELSAQLTALAELGDPRVAAATFQKRYLTVSEAKRVQIMAQRAAKPLFSFRMLPLDIIPLAVLVFLCLPLPQLFDLRLFTVGILVAYAGLRLIPRWLCATSLPRTSFISGLALSAFLTSVALSSWFALFSYSINHNFILCGCWFLYMLLINNIGFQSPWRIWNKLRKTVEARHELPPWQTTAS
jgi:hypothetical protein